MSMKVNVCKENSKLFCIQLPCPMEVGQKASGKTDLGKILQDTAWQRQHLSARWGLSYYRRDGGSSISQQRLCCKAVWRMGELVHCLCYFRLFWLMHQNRCSIWPISSIFHQFHQRRGKHKQGKSRGFWLSFRLVLRWKWNIRQSITFPQISSAVL